MKNFFLAVCVVASTISSAASWDREQLISTQNTSLMVTAVEGEALKFAYYGDRIESDQCNHVHDAWVGLNRHAYPVFGTSTNVISGMQVTHADGNMTLDLAVSNVERQTTDKGELLTITMKDKVYPFNLVVNYLSHYKEDVIETWIEVNHSEKKPITLYRFDSGYMPIRRGNVWLSHLHGSWGSESLITQEPLNGGLVEIRNTDGQRSGHQARPEIMFSLDGKPNEKNGRVIGAVLCWSGNYSLRIDTDNNQVHHFFAGMSSESSYYKLEKGEVFTTPHLAYTYSNCGVGGASRNYHRWARAGKVHGCDKDRDILLNSWEGVYLNVNEPDMERMMSDFAAMGGELFVMDDGWFGGKYPRTRDNSSLGDWVVDTNKLPNGIEGLIDVAKKNGLKFGIWIEPECTNSISELMEKHPEWALQAKNRPIRYGRGGTQYILDLTRPEVQDFVYSVFDNLMTQYPEIAYIKWDANVELYNYGSTYLPADKQSHIYIEYHRGLENILIRLREKYPDVVIQACGSGGGRANYGIMPYHEEFWVSDNTDALQRIYMQWGSSYFYPAIAMAQHVSASPNHQTGRRTPIKFRFDVAMTGRLGIEMQPKDMTDDEREFAKQAIADYKSVRSIIQHGDLYRLISPYDKLGVSSLMYVNENKSQAVFFAYKLEHFHNQVIPRMLMDGLDANRTYTLRELNVATGEKPCYLDGKRFSGRMLMNTGVEIPLNSEYSSRVFELIAE